MKIKFLIIVLMIVTSLIGVSSASPLDDCVNDIRDYISNLLPLSWYSPTQYITVDTGGIHFYSGHTGTLTWYLKDGCNNPISSVTTTSGYRYYDLPLPTKSGAYNLYCTSSGCDVGGDWILINLNTLTQTPVLATITNDPGGCLTECEWSNLVPLTVVMINVPKIIGDVNGDGIINIVDATALAQATPPACQLRLIGIQLKAGDVDGDGKVTYQDALFLAQYTVNNLTDTNAKNRIGKLISSSTTTPSITNPPIEIIPDTVATIIGVKTTSGFTGIFALVGLISAVFLLRRKI